MALALTAAEINTLCGGGAVEHCSSNPVVTATAALPTRGGPATPGQPAAGSKSADLNKKVGAPAKVNTLLGNIGLGASHTGGTGVTVALIDSGIEPSRAFQGRIKAFYDYTDVERKPNRPYDDYGHGTHVAGLIGGVQVADKDVQGVAPGVEFVVLKVLNSKGSGRTSDVISAIELAVANRRGASPLNIDIINLSLGHPIHESSVTDPLVRAVERASAAGVIVVVSAGNFGTNPDTGEIGYAGTTSPGNAPSAITVGAYDPKASVSRLDDRVTAYSSRGPTWLDGFSKPDIVAPGHLLSSETASSSALYGGVPTLRRKGSSGKNFLSLSGTSMAAGVTTGAVALLREKAGANLTPNLAKALLQFTAIPLLDDNRKPYDGITQGTGGLNAGGALRVATAIDFSVTDTHEIWTPSLPLCASVQAGATAASVSCSTSIDGRLHVWARNIVWGDNVVWGNTVHYNRPTWNLLSSRAPDGTVLGGNIVWGDNIVWADGILWGGDLVKLLDNIVWGSWDNIVWGQNVIGPHGLNGGVER